MPHAHSSVAIVPSLPAKSFAEIEALIEALDGTASEIQIDIVDGVFAPTVSWPFTEEDVPEQLMLLNPLAQKISIEIDCMVMQPEKYLDTFVEIGVRKVIVHAGSTTEYEYIFTHAKENGYLVALAIMNDTPLDIIEKYINKIDYVQVMGIEKIGEQGQPFDKRTPQTVRNINRNFPELEIAVDGSVNEETVQQLYAAGVTRFAPGSAISKTSNPKESYKHLCSLLQS